MHTGNEAAPEVNRTSVERTSDLDMVVTRSFDAPVHIVFEAWRNPALFQQWWVPKSADLKLISCEMDVRTGGSYRLVFAHPLAEQPMAFFGRYLEVITNECIVWTNDESDLGAVTTVRFAAVDGKTRVTLHERYPTREALDEAIAGSAEGLPEQFAQLAALLAERA